MNRAPDLGLATLLLKAGPAMAECHLDVAGDTATGDAAAGE